MLFNSEKIKRNFVTDIVKKDVKNYFLEEKCLNNYRLLDVVDYSFHCDDDYLFMVVAEHKKNKTYAVWTCWNEQRHSLNYGHYDLVTLDECRKVLEKYYHR